MNARKRMSKRLLGLPLAVLCLALLTPALGAAEQSRQRPPKQGDAPSVATRAESRGTQAGATASRPSPSSPAARTRPPGSSGGSSASPTRVERRYDGRRYDGRRYPYRHYPRGPYGGYYHGYLGYYPHHYYSWYWPWGWGAYPIYYPVYTSVSGDAPGALDLDLRPEKAAVYLDGQFIGVADNFDGFPDYLWLEPGTYDLVFYMDGFRTIARQYSIYSGVVIDVEDRMVPGESVPPQDLVAKSTDRRDERLRRDAERQREAAAAPAGEPFDARGEPGRLRLTLAPPDASVYLDGRFLGTAEELGQLHAGLIVDPGEHVLEVVRPGYASESFEFEVAAGEEVTIDLTLEAAG